MPSLGAYDNGKAQSLVFVFSDHLPTDGEYQAPEDDFAKWVESALFVDVAIAGDEAAYDKHSAEEREAWRLFCNALEATGNLFELYKTNLKLFQKMAGQMMFLPCFISWHPHNQRFNQDLRRTSQLGRQQMESGVQPIAKHLAEQSWPVRYAYAIISTIDLTLDTYEERLPHWAEIYGYGVKHPISMKRYEAAAIKMGWDEEKRRRELPKYEGSYDILPAWTESLPRLRRPFNQDHAVDYWRTGKEMILEEVPNFHLRREWQSYHKRRYKGGAKAGVIQHAIFKDILAALKTIAGANRTKRKTASKSS